MILWRISRYHDVIGAGGLKAAGRWHYAGHPIIYLAESPAAALLEVCVHTGANDVPPAFTLLKVEGPELEKPTIKPADLPADWMTRLEITRDLGTAWLSKNKDILMRVPSALVPVTTNLLFNPLHPDATKLHIAEIFSYPFDGRLKT